LIFSLGYKALKDCGTLELGVTGNPVAAQKPALSDPMGFLGG
jgi:hypothetical protein